MVKLYEPSRFGGQMQECQRDDAWPHVYVLITEYDAMRRRAEAAIREVAQMNERLGTSERRREMLAARVGQLTEALRFDQGRCDAACIEAWGKTSHDDVGDDGEYAFKTGFDAGFRAALADTHDEPTGGE